MTRARLVTLLAALALLLPAVAAEGTVAPPAGAATASVAGVGVAIWVGAPDARNATLAPGAADTLRVVLTFSGNLTEPNVTRTWFVNLTSSSLVFDNATLQGSFASPFPEAPQAAGATQVRAASNATGDLAYTANVTLLETRGNATLVLGQATLNGALAVVAPAPAPGIPLWAWYLLGAVVLLGVVALGVSARNRSVRRRMNEGPRRSQVMREMELEKQLEKAKEPERVAEIKAEIRQQEQVREKRRELQILEAKRADVLKTMDLLRKRHEAGGLTKLQYDTMLAKRQADLERIEREIAEMEAQDAGGGAAA